MTGPVAPRDPEKARAYFYIMRGKEICGLKQGDGEAVQFIYESDGRLANSAQIVGNITDSRILELLGTVKGFRTLVHSIGVSVEMEHPAEKIEFVFQMYGKKDLYGGGTNLVATLQGDGMEQRICLSDYEWSLDDDVPGQIRFTFDKPERVGKADVRFYLNDGFTAPEDLTEEKVDLHSEEYYKMVQRSLMNLGNTYRIRKVIEKARAGKEVTLAFIGGSITQGAGAVPIHTECYAYKAYQLFQKRFARNNNVRFIKAGVGGTPSELGMIRFDRDVLREGEQPDLVVIEFAVNDEGDETKGDCYESLVRKVLKLPWRPAVVLLFSVFANDWNLQERLQPVGRQYDLPMVSILDAVTPQFSGKEQKRVITKNQFFYDMFHPTNLGHTIMADCLEYLMEVCDTSDHARVDSFRQGMTEEEVLEQCLRGEPAIGNSFEKVKLLDRRDGYEGASMREGGFDATDHELQCVEMDQDLCTTPEFPYNWMYDGTKPDRAFFELTITCRALFLIFKDSGEVDAGTADVLVDGEFRFTADPHVNNWLHCNAVLVFQEKETAAHTVRIQMSGENLDKKFTILGFGYVE